MKDQLITVIEALRVSRAELRTHDTRRVKNGPRTIERLKEILFDESVSQALNTLGPREEAPSVVPTQVDAGYERVSRSPNSERGPVPGFRRRQR